MPCEPAELLPRVGGLWDARVRPPTPELLAALSVAAWYDPTRAGTRVGLEAMSGVYCDGCFARVIGDDPTTTRGVSHLDACCRRLTCAACGGRLTPLWATACVPAAPPGEAVFVRDAPAHGQPGLILRPHPLRPGGMPISAWDLWSCVGTGPLTVQHVGYHRVVKVCGEIDRTFRLWPYHHREGSAA